jgi:P pilus assembly chaperone PapD
VPLRQQQLLVLRHSKVQQPAVPESSYWMCLQP